MGYFKRGNFQKRKFYVARQQQVLCGSNPTGEFGNFSSVSLHIWYGISCPP